MVLIQTIQQRMRTFKRQRESPSAVSAGLTGCKANASTRKAHARVAWKGKSQLKMGTCRVCIGKVASVLPRLSVSSTWEPFLLFGRAHSPETFGAAVYSASSAAREWLSLDFLYKLGTRTWEYLVSSICSHV